MEINNLLDQCMKKLGAKTDYQLAKLSGIPRARISDYRRGDRIPDAFACFKLGEILGIDRDLLIANFEAQAAKNPEVKEFWEKYFKRLGGIAATIALAVNLIMTPTPSKAAPVLKSEGAILYIMLTAQRIIQRCKKLTLIGLKQITGFRMPVFSIG